MEPLTSFLAGEHGFFVHFPIALITVGALVRLYWAFKPSDASWHGSLVTTSIGAVATFLAILSGIARVNFRLQLHGLIGTHRNFAIALGFWSIAHLLLLIFWPKFFQSKVAATLWFILGAVLALTTGYFGSEMAE
jgi:uncharacterized membrane protein